MRAVLVACALLIIFGGPHAPADPPPESGYADRQPKGVRAPHGSTLPSETILRSLRRAYNRISESLENEDGERRGAEIVVLETQVHRPEKSDAESRIRTTQLCRSDQSLRMTVSTELTDVGATMRILQFDRKTGMGQASEWRQGGLHETKGFDAEELASIASVYTEGMSSTVACGFEDLLANDQVESLEEQVRELARHGRVQYSSTDHGWRAEVGLVEAPESGRFRSIQLSWDDRAAVLRIRKLFGWPQRIAVDHRVIVFTMVH